MKAKKIENVVEKKMGHLEERVKKILLPDNEESIHLFRIEYKKLRTFIRVSNFESRKNKYLTMPKKLRRIYHSAGAVRNEQVYYDGIMPFYKATDKYPNTIAKSINRLNNKLVNAVEKFHFQRRDIINELPHKIGKKKVRKFLDSKKAEMNRLLAKKMKSEEMHALRIDLKDFIYSCDIFKLKVCRYMPVAGRKTISQLNKLNDLLGDHQDYVIGLSLLATAAARKISQKEGRVLDEIRVKWEREKLALYNSVYGSQI